MNSTHAPGVDFLALAPGAPPRPIPASDVLGGLTAADVCEAVDGVRSGMTNGERVAAVARIVRRRQRRAVRVRETADSQAGEDSRPTAVLVERPGRRIATNGLRPPGARPDRSV